MNIIYNDSGIAPRGGGGHSYNILVGLWYYPSVHMYIMKHLGFITYLLITCALGTILFTTDSMV